MLLEITKALGKHRVDYAVVGGWAVALHGVLRGTVDLDLLIALTQDGVKRAEEALNSQGLVSRLPLKAQDVYTYRKEYIKNRNLLAWSFWDPTDPTRQIDILLLHDLREVKTQTFKIRGQPVEVISKPDLIRMKRAAGRPQDLIDADALEAVE